MLPIGGHKFAVKSIDSSDVISLHCGSIRDGFGTGDPKRVSCSGSSRVDSGTGDPKRDSSSGSSGRSEDMLESDVEEIVHLSVKVFGVWFGLGSFVKRLLNK